VDGTRLELVTPAMDVGALPARFALRFIVYKYSGLERTRTSDLADVNGAL
jgi:hypothetical protein